MDRTWGCSTVWPKLGPFYLLIQWEINRTPLNLHGLSDIVLWEHVDGLGQKSNSIANFFLPLTYRCGIVIFDSEPLEAVAAHLQDKRRLYIPRKMKSIIMYGI